jgi:hypothetical protein
VHRLAGLLAQHDGLQADRLPPGRVQPALDGLAPTGVAAVMLQAKGRP